MKKLHLTLMVSLCLAITALAQSPDSLARKAKQSDYLANYHRALKYDDLGSAAYAITGYLESGGALNYRDSLSIIYYRLGNFGGAFRLANEMYEADNKNTTALTLLADITGRAGETKTSLDWYEKLCPLVPSPYNYYQLATRQFMLERIGECRQTLQKVIADSAKAREELVALEIQQGTSENVPVLAAAYNMLGALAQRDKQTDEARKMYEQALAVFPRFVIGQQNLESLKKPAPAAKPAAKAPPKPAKG